MRWHSNVCNKEHLEVLHDLPHVFDRHDEDAEQKLYKHFEHRTLKIETMSRKEIFFVIIM